nr:helix-turn-helix domain-containing protein [Alloyangia pacifica]
MVKSPERQRGVQSVDMAMRLLEIVRKDGRPMMLRDIAVCAGITSAQAHTYMSSLKKFGMIEQIGDAGRYALSDATLTLARHVIRNDPTLRATIETARSLATDIEEMVTVDCLVQQKPTVIFAIQGPRTPSLSLRPGTRNRIGNSASARLFDAWSDAPEMAPSLCRIIRTGGYAHAEGTPVPHLASLAAPVFRGGALVASISVIGFPDAMAPEQERPVLQALLAATNVLQEAPA